LSQCLLLLQADKVAQVMQATAIIIFENCIICGLIIKNIWLKLLRKALSYLRLYWQQLGKAL
jgi:hypothetical protein